MKKIYIIISILFFSFATFSQSSASKIETVIKSEKYSELDKIYKKYDVMEINFSDLNKKVKENRSIDLKIGNTIFDLTLEPNDILSPSYLEIETTESGVVEKKRSSHVKTYKGYCGTEKKDMVYLTIDENFIDGSIQVLDKKYLINTVWVQGLSKKEYKVIFTDANNLIYEDSKTACLGALDEAVEEHDFNLETVEKETLPIVKSKAEMRPTAVGGPYYLEIATEADYEYYQLFGQNTNNHIISIINQAEAVYVNTFNVHFLITFQNYYSTSLDPYSVNVQHQDPLLDEVRNYWEANFSYVKRDVVAFYCGRPFGVAGAAWQSQICASPTYAYLIVQKLGTTYDDAVLFAHEMGHSIGSGHDFPDNRITRNGPLMSPSIQSYAIPMYFSSVSTSSINNHLNNYNWCLNSSSCTNDYVLGPINITNFAFYGGYNNITTSGSVIINTNGALVHLSSKNSVILNGGFEVKTGSMLEISTGSCFPINGN